MDKDTIIVGDRVSFVAGKGKSAGRVANIADGMATIATDKGQLLNRRLDRLEKEPVVAETVLVPEVETLA